MRTLSATDFLQEAKTRLSTVKSIIEAGNATFNTLVKGIEETIRHRGMQYTRKQLFDELASYGQEKVQLELLIEFYEGIGIN
jgi:hypothetical protein